MKILLLNPPVKNNKKFIREGRCTQEQGVWATLWPPISLVMIAAVLEEDGFDVRVIDCPAQNMTWDELMNEIRRTSPDFAIWSTGTPSIQSDLGLGAELKEIDQNLSTAVFGTHVSVLDRECMESFPYIDFIFRNEPEMTALDVARMLRDGTGPEGISGLTFRDQTGEIVSNSARSFLEDIDRLPFPAWHLINTESYTLPMKGRKFLIVSPQRGCPFHCTFCTCRTYYGEKLRKRSVKNVIAEIEYDIEKYHVRDFLFWAETFVLDRAYVEALCKELLEKGLNISWTCNSRVDIADGRLLELMAKAGCWMISFGIESADQKVLDEAQKGIKVEQAYDAVRLAGQAGIKTAGHFIFGLPGDTEHAMEKTTVFAKSLGLDIAQFYCGVPFPGSRLYEQAKSEGWIKDCDYSDFNQDHTIMELPTVSSRTVQQYRSRAFRSFYARPRAWWRIALLIELKGLKQVWQALRGFLKWSG